MVVRTTATTIVTLTTGGLSLIAYAVYTAVVGAGVGAAYDVGGRELANRYVRPRDQAFFSAIEKAICAVLQLLSTPNSPSSRQRLPPTPSENQLLDLLNDLALAVQLIALVVQSYVRGAVLPFRFPFLNYSVSTLVLKGASKNPQAPKIIAMSQKLSCLGNMIRKKRS